MVRKKSKVQVRLASADIPKMPEGYYSGDKPNPNLRAFVEAHLKEHPYDPIYDDYDVKAFDKPIETTKATAIYNMHTYWSKKPHDAIRQYIQHYTKVGDLVLDPFCGSGSTALAALTEGRAAIAIDRSPAATFITKNYCSAVDVNKLTDAFEWLKMEVKPELNWLYDTRCDRCGGNAHTESTVYSQTFECPKCMTKLPLFDCVEIEVDKPDGDKKTIRACPICYKTGHIEEISSRSDKYGTIPVLVNYICDNGCRPARNQRGYNDLNLKKREYFKKYDEGKINEIESKIIPYWYPKDRMMNAPEDQECWGVKWRAGTSNFRTVDELFTKRNLWALAALLNTIRLSPMRSELEFVFHGNIMGATRMQRFRESGGGHASGTYYIPQISIEREQWGCFNRKFEDVSSALDEILLNLISHQLIISTESAFNISSIPSNSIDFIFTDPPYAEKVQYGELNFIWEAWLGFDTHWHDDEIIVNEVRGKTENDWADMMRKAMTECYRVLKPGRWISLCYHDTSEGTWSLLQDIMAEVGFVVDKSDSALFIDTKQKSYNQIVADKVNKRDLVINFQKPKPGQSKLDIFITGDEDEGTFNEKVLTIIKDYLNIHPGTTKDRIYDDVVSRMVRSGRMEPHNFDALLTRIANSSNSEGVSDKIDHWYLKGSELEVEDSTESAKEDAAAAKLKIYMTKWLKDHPSDEGIHYSDLFEHYIIAVKDMPRRPLAEWVPDYFYKADERTYRLPASDDEEKLKAESRSKGVNRRIKRYLSYITQGLTVPEEERPSDITLADWIRNCKRSGMYEQGKILFDKGGINLEALPQEARINVEEDYNVCVRMFARLNQTKKAKKVKSAQKRIVEDGE